jgi:hypothetical protein
VVEEVLMKRLLLIAFMMGSIGAIIGALASFAAAAPPDRDIAVANIPDKTKLLKATLQGKYIFVHDDSMMAKGEPCLYIYEYRRPGRKPEVKPEKLVVSFHLSRLSAKRQPGCADLRDVEPRVV